MVIGLETLREAFKGYEDCYTISVVRLVMS